MERKSKTTNHLLDRSRNKSGGASGSDSGVDVDAALHKKHKASFPIKLVIQNKKHSKSSSAKRHKKASKENKPDYKCDKKSEKKKHRKAEVKAVSAVQRKCEGASSSGTFPTNLKNSVKDTYFRFVREFGKYGVDFYFTKSSIDEAIKIRGVRAEGPHVTHDFFETHHFHIKLYDDKKRRIFNSHSFRPGKIIRVDREKHRNLSFLSYKILMTS